MQAYYDHKPLTIEKVGNGSYLYHYNIKEVEQDQGDEEMRTQWECEEVTVWLPLTSNKITEAVIAERWDKNYEQKLINEYNSAIFGLYDDDTATKKKQAYMDFLQERADLKAMVDEDCKKYGIG